MSDSYAVLPVNSEVRAWLEREGLTVPESDGRTITLLELKSIVSSLDGASVQWSEGPEFYDGLVTSRTGMSTTLIIGNPGHGGAPCEFHFRGGESELIVTIVKRIAALAGSHVVYAHSGASQKLLKGAQRDAQPYAQPDAQQRRCAPLLGSLRGFAAPAQVSSTLAVTSPNLPLSA